MLHRPWTVAVIGLTLLAGGCAHASRPRELSRQRAIAIARPHVSFQPSRTDVVKATSMGRAVWRVTFRGRLPGQPSMLYETLIVDVDRRTGDIVSVSRT